MDTCPSMELDQSLWVRACGGGGEATEAFRVVFHRHVDRVATHCRRRLASLDGLDDAVSSVFVAAWESRNRVRFVDGSILPWLLTVATNVTSKIIRSQATYRRFLAKHPPPREETYDIAIDVIDRLIRDSRADRVSYHLSTLSRVDQQILSLVIMGELTHAAAASVLRIPVGTVKSRVSRASARLRNKLIADEYFCINLVSEGNKSD